MTREEIIRIVYASNLDQGLKDAIVQLLDEIDALEERIRSLEVER